MSQPENVTFHRSTAQFLCTWPAHPVLGNRNVLQLSAAQNLFMNGRKTSCVMCLQLPPRGHCEHDRCFIAVQHMQQQHRYRNTAAVRFKPCYHLIPHNRPFSDCHNTSPTFPVQVLDCSVRMKGLGIRVF